MIWRWAGAPSWIHQALQCRASNTPDCSITWDSTILKIQPPTLRSNISQKSLIEIASNVTQTCHTRQSEMADLARRATRWVGTWECACQISWWSVEKWRRYYILKFHGNTFRWPTTLTVDLKFWKYLSVTEYPYSMCMLSFMMIGWEMTETLHFEILRKHGQTHTHTHTHTNKQTNKQTNRHGHYNTSPSPYGGRGNNLLVHLIHHMLTSI